MRIVSGTESTALRQSETESGAWPQLCGRRLRAENQAGYSEEKIEAKCVRCTQNGGQRRVDKLALDSNSANFCFLRSALVFTKSASEFLKR